MSLRTTCRKSNVRYTFTGGIQHIVPERNHLRVKRWGASVQNSRSWSLNQYRVSYPRTLKTNKGILVTEIVFINWIKNLITYFIRNLKIHKSTTSNRIKLRYYIRLIVKLSILKKSNFNYSWKFVFVQDQ